jgi:hypothetical protein
VLLLRPHEITDVIDIGKAIDLVEQGYREVQDFPLINAPRRRVLMALAAQESWGCRLKRGGAAPTLLQ